MKTLEEICVEIKKLHEAKFHYSIANESDILVSIAEALWTQTYYQAFMAEMLNKIANPPILITTEAPPEPRLCGHGYIHITCGDCNANNLMSWGK